jgi:hypothetical protein
MINERLYLRFSEIPSQLKYLKLLVDFSYPIRKQDDVYYYFGKEGEYKVQKELSSYYQVKKINDRGLLNVK